MAPMALIQVENNESIHKKTLSSRNSFTFNRFRGILDIVVKWLTKLDRLLFIV